jgi:hypothetical protein
MPRYRDSWHDYIKRIEREYGAVRMAFDRLVVDVRKKPDILKKGDPIRVGIRDAHENLEGTYIIRLFAAFEAALRSYVQAEHPAWSTKEATMIDQVGDRRGHGVRQLLRDQAHLVRRARNFWAHDDDAEIVALDIATARGHLQEYLAELPERWG